ncbi:MAG: Carbohydrate acetyl esterase/feruloyl esterase [Chthoniobacteraceae bacterium]|nr:Carbohydrate acetyl esterase/feruloyl esterase [Chthoniobacteraceae bacterium]
MRRECCLGSPLMKLLPGLFVVLQSLVVIAHAQTTPPTPTARPVPISSPEIKEDHHVVFRLKAPQAREVSVSGQGFARAPMTRDAASGEWSVTVGPVEPGVWEYSFNVDGVDMIDSANPAIKPQRQPKTSILQIPGTPPLVWDFQNVPHGTLHEHTFQAAHSVRRFHVYTPPGYERDSAGKFPVLYLVHGFGDNDASWSAHGKANWILDNLIAKGSAKPMLVVMPDGHPLAPGTGPRGDYGKANSEAFEAELVNEILPLIESTYRVRASADGRAIAGLSMGGGHSLYTGLRHSDIFSAIGAFSAGVPSQESLNQAFDNAGNLNEKLRLFWIACGKSDSLVDRNRKLDAQLTEKGINHTWVESEGGHAWPVWRQYLAQFVPLLFVEPKAP